MRSPQRPLPTETGQSNDREVANRSRTVNNMADSTKQSKEVTLLTVITEFLESDEDDTEYDADDDDIVALNLSLDSR